MSTQPCGCDPEANHMCEYHTKINEAIRAVENNHCYPGAVIEVPRVVNIPTVFEVRPNQSIRGLPVMDSERKALPVFRGVLMYFPDAILEVARVSMLGNQQHNPGEPLHWAREKSAEQMDTAQRHAMDHGLGNTKDVDGAYHLAKAIWRHLAELQLTIERDRACVRN